MKKQLIIIGMIIILLTVGLSGCNETNTNETNTNKEKILGAWLANVTTGPGKGGKGAYTYFSNGTFLASSTTTEVWGIFNITDEKLTMSRGNSTFTYDYTFSDNDNKVTLIDGDWTIILTRK